MHIYKNDDLKQYLNQDWIMDLLLKERTDQISRTDEWLYRMDNKRMIYADVYGDILRGDIASNTKVLDIGGGVNSLTRVLAQNSRYTLVDYLAHGGEEQLKEMGVECFKRDWNDLEMDEYDVVIANDLFPDVDQRIELFINKFLPICKEIRLIITYYNAPKYYTTKRIDDTEIMTFLSWDGEITALKLKKFWNSINGFDEKVLEKMPKTKESIYRNGRQVMYVTMRGQLA